MGLDTKQFFSVLEDSSTVFKPRKIKGYEKFCSWLMTNSEPSHSSHKKYIAYFEWANKTALFLIFATIMLAFSNPLVLFGTLISLGAANISNKIKICLKEIDQKNEFLKSTQNLMPPEQGHLYEKTELATYNHLQSFVVKDNIIWYAIREGRDVAPVWQRLFLYDLGSKKIRSIRADGENLMVRVKENNHEDKIFYKKVIKESRDKLGILTVSESTSRPKSIHAWFRLPIIRFLFPKFYNKRLIMPKTHLWTMSHSGKFKHTIRDKLKQIHANWGVTTVYEFDGTHFILHDPYVPPHTVIKIPLPAGFKLWHFDASASNLVIVGEVAGKPILYARKLDYDQLGLNPLIRYGYQPNTHKLTRVMPMSFWKEHSLPDNIDNSYLININQVDKGDKSLELKLFSANHNKAYFKNIKDKMFSQSVLVNLNFKTVSHKFRPLSAQVSGHCYLKTKQLETLNVLLGENYTKLTLPSFHSDELNHIAHAHKNNGQIDTLYCIRQHNFVQAAVGVKQKKWHMIHDGKVIMNFEVKENKFKSSILFSDQAKSLSFKSKNHSLKQNKMLKPKV
jgi:hypothetical protein